MIKFIQDTLTRIYNMTKDTTIVDSDMIKKICKNLKISKRDWTDFTKYYKYKMNTLEIPYAHLVSLLLPRNLNLSFENRILVREGILQGAVLMAIIKLNCLTL